MVGETRYRIWRMYLAGCAYSFDHAWASIYQILAVKSYKPQIDRLPLTRNFMCRETS